MFRFHCVIVLAVFFCTTLFADKPVEGFTTRFDIQQDLFSQARQPADVPLFIAQTEERTDQKKSVGLAALYSLLLPGLGEYYAGGFSTGKFFSIAEGALWLSYATFDVYGSSLKRDAIRFAAVHAGIDPNGKGDQFFVDIGNFLNTTEFDEKRNRDREPQKVYGNRPGYSWNWGPADLAQSDMNRSRYKEQRLSGENMLNNRKFVVAAIVINHVVSAINAARIAISHNNDLDDHIGMLQFKADVLGGITNPHGVMLTVSRIF